MARLTLRFQRHGEGLGWLGLRLVHPGIAGSAGSPLGEFEFEAAIGEKLGGPLKGVSAILAFFLAARLAYCEDRRSDFSTSSRSDPFVESLQILNKKKSRKTQRAFLILGQLEGSTSTDQSTYASAAHEIVRYTLIQEVHHAVLNTELLRPSEIHVELETEQGNSQISDSPGGLNELLIWLNDKYWPVKGASHICESATSPSSRRSQSVFASEMSVDDIDRSNDQNQDAMVLYADLPTAVANTDSAGTSFNRKNCELPCEAKPGIRVIAKEIYSIIFWTSLIAIAVVSGFVVWPALFFHRNQIPENVENVPARIDQLVQPIVADQNGDSQLAGLPGTGLEPISRIAQTRDVDFVGLDQDSKGAPSLLAIGPSSQVTAASFSPDGMTIAYGQLDGSLRLIDGKSLTLKSVLTSHSAPVSKLAWSQDGAFLASCSSDQTVRIMSPDGNIITTFQRNGPVVDLEWHPNDSGRLAIVENSGSDREDMGRAAIVETNGTTISEFCVDAYYVSKVDWSASGDCLVTAGGEGRIKFWLSDGSLVRHSEICPSGTGSMSCSQNGEVLSTRGKLKSFGLLTAGASSWQSISLADTGVSVAWNPQGNKFAVTAVNGDLLVGEFGNSTIQQTVTAKARSQDLIVWNRVGDRLLVAGDSLSIWRVEVDEQIRLVEECTVVTPLLVPVNVIARHPKSGDFAMAGGDGFVGLIDSSAKSTLNRFNGHSESVSKCAWSFDGNWLATGGDDRYVIVWTQRGEAVKKLPEFESGVSDLAWANNDNWLLSASGKIATRFHPLLGFTSPLESYDDAMSVAWNCVDQQIAVGLAGLAGIHVWSSERGFRAFEKIPGDFESGLRDNVRTLKFHPSNESMFAAGSTYGRAVIYDLKPGKEVQLCLKNGGDWFHKQAMLCMSWSHSGDRLVTSSVDGRVGIWSVDGVLQKSWIVRPMTSLEWSPDDKWIVGGAMSHGVWALDLTQEKHRLIAPNVHGVRAIAWAEDSRVFIFGTALGLYGKIDVQSGNLVSASLLRPNSASIPVIDDSDFVANVDDLFAEGFVTSPMWTEHKRH